MLRADLPRQAFLAAYAILQLTILLLWAVDSPLGTQASIPAAALDFVAACILCVLSSYEHTRSIAPSVIIDLYLFFSLLCDAARLRTLFLIEDPEVRSIAVVGALSAAIKVGVLISEASSKRKDLLEQYRNLSPEATSGTYSKAVFWWMNGLLKAGYCSLLGVSDLYEIDERLSSVVVGRRFETAWAAANKTRKHALFLTTAFILRWQLLLSATPRLILVGFKYAQPFLLTRTISYVSNRKDQPGNVGWALIGAYAIVYIGLAVCTASFEYLLNRCLTIIRGGLVTMIYKKTIDLSLIALDENAALTLMSADVERIIDSLLYFHDLWASFIEVGIAIYLLYAQIGIACLAPSAVFLVSGGGMLTLARILPRAQKHWVEGIQYRVSFTSRLLGMMRSIKLLGLSKVATNLTQALRVREVRMGNRYRQLLLVRIILQNSSLAVAPLVTYGAYVALGASAGRRLDSTTAFGVLSVLNLVEQPLRMLIVSFPQVMAATSCFTRIQEFLSSESRKDHRLPMRPEVQNSTIAPWGPRSLSTRNATRSEGDAAELSTLSKRTIPTSEVIVLEQCSFGWSAAEPRTVKHVNIRIHSSTINMVIGPVGCGKSTLLKGILGETPSSSGFVYTATHRLAFADQDAWTLNSTIADNIKCQSSFDAQWYENVIQACGLRQDLNILPDGDETVVGSRGITLSGGQKQRLALARALYAKEEVIVLDDIFSGLDADTEDHIFSQLFGMNGLFRKLGTTVIFATHAVHRLPHADHIVAIEADGTISEQGSYASLAIAGGYVQGLKIKQQDRESIERVPKVASSGCKKPSTAPQDLVTNMTRTTGDWQTYKYYFQAAGMTSSLLSLLWSVLFVLSTKLPGLLITYWTDAEVNDSSSANTLYLTLFGVLAGIALAAMALLVAQVWLDMIPKSANGLHFSLLETVMRAPLSFFTKTDSGTTLNRFSQDMTLIDGDLPGAYVEVIITLFQSLTAAALMIATAQYFLATLPLIIIVLYALQKFYLRTSRQIRLLDLEAKAPLYSHFQETLSGLATIRAFGWTAAFVEKHLELLDQSQRPFYLLFCVQRWLQVVLDLMVAALATILMVIVVELRDDIKPGLVGLGMLNVMTFNTNLTGMIKNWTQLEISLGAIVRIRDFVTDTECEEKEREDLEPAERWPQKGALQIRDFSASYSETSVPVLHGVDLDIRPGEKLGICGRSGSGKSSLLASLLHLLEYRNGSMSVDGQDIAYIPRDTLRQRLNVIPQEPYWITSESVRFNMSPWPQGSTSEVSSQFTDVELVTALTKCQIWALILAKGGLDTKMDAGFLSHGERQLFCLARAILRKSKLVILDEVTASVDVHTDVLMQRVIREEFRECTIISVAHRLDTIVDFDRIAVLSAGRIVELGTPEELLRKEGGAFRQLYEF